MENIKLWESIEDQERIKELYESGLSLRQVAAICKIGHGTVDYYLKKLGVKKRHKCFHHKSRKERTHKTVQEKFIEIQQKLESIETKLDKLLTP